MPPPTLSYCFRCLFSFTLIISLGKTFKVRKSQKFEKTWKKTFLSGWEVSLEAVISYFLKSCESFSTLLWAQKEPRRCWKKRKNEWNEKETLQSIFLVIDRLCWFFYCSRLNIWSFESEIHKIWWIILLNLDQFVID